MILHAEYTDYDEFLRACHSGELEAVKELYSKFSHHTKHNRFLKMRASDVSSGDVHDWISENFGKL